MHAESVSLLGLGLVGSELARRWLDDGQRVLGYDLSPAACETHRARGGEVVESTRALFQASTFVVLSLPDSRVVAQVLSDHGDSLRSGQCVIDTTTGDPNDAARHAESLRQRGVDYVEATLVGSSRQIGAGQAVVLLGGEAELVSRARELLAPFAQRAFHVGPVGHASRLKLVVNLVLGLHRAVLAEGLALAEAAGLDPAQTLEILRASPASSRVMETKGELMLRRAFEPPQARLRQHRKDVSLIEQLGESLDQDLPLTQLHAQLLDQAIAAGWGELDNSAIFQLWRSQ